MKRRALLMTLILGWMLIATGVRMSASAEEATVLAQKSVFGKLQRPPVPFDHDLHIDALEEQGCGACHHVYDEKKGRLVYEEDEEMSCTECHGKKKGVRAPGLREAYHGSCTVCHRRMAKEHEASGPVTCGECHEKE
jgi:hypothetical protein